MMKKDKILLNISNLEDIDFYQKLGISNFLFPLEGFSVGYSSFSLEDISATNTQGYLLVNRLLTDNDIDQFLKLQIPKNIKGIIVEDVGLFYVLKDSSLELINFQNHLNNSYETVNFWTEYYDSPVLSTDITIDEITEILDRTKKPLIINTFGYPMIMYSRRKLLSNFSKHLGDKEKKTLNIKNSDLIKFQLKENEYGTAIFDDHLLDIRFVTQDLDDTKIKFYLFNSEFLTRETMEKAICNEIVTNTTDGFLHKKTIYRIGDIK